ncbi:hypothetical protein N7471_002232 [Penicillium samsonianum]|uniref:uncharacterized protein n=1 Tax=Penicillium samsonianum TaxID=1882272 RepID=UPI00254715FB|nr:uncharacterized protein N7471_002232 [Penicillium samsonianum]KAJ6142779.1 hypothetical protein N7471_002232 [Penicillium samsonianum]
MVRFVVPAFLRANGAYRRYLQDGAVGELSLPQYELTPNGEVTVYYGEVVCRLANCGHRWVSFYDTRNLRLHLRRHGVIVAWTQRGRMSQGAMDAAIAWYEADEGEIDTNIADEEVGEVEDGAHEDEF